MKRKHLGTPNGIRPRISSRLIHRKPGQGAGKNSGYVHEGYLVAYSLIPAAEVGGAGNSGFAFGVGGSLGPETLYEQTIYNLFSFGANWCRLALGVSFTDLLGYRPPKIRFPDNSLVWTQLQDSTGSGYSYGGTVTDIRAYLLAEVGNSIPVEITNGATP